MEEAHSPDAPHAGDTDGDSAAVPRREIRDPQVLRAMAHPVRLRIFEELIKSGRATATELAELLDESAANCSWHLRQLQRYGLIEEAGGGTGRQRPWRPVAQSVHVPSASAGAEEFARANDALMEVQVAREVEAFRGWEWARHDAPPDWRDASFSTFSWDFLTAEELAAFKRDLDAVFERHVLTHTHRSDPDRRPADARPVRFVAWGFPADLREAGPGGPADRGGDEVAGDDVDGGREGN